ncbi:hypothetical protein F7725_022247 [Dissostichus mawsoni]|uniref:Uncharacterized protein n=1 Tax=Dissostichus mawsoni TaxID=36200 RepID=A0A7J5YX73_DISMA|nr:hypothetical protein F7725_022247 [Dissostichus mawsoni]
MLLVNLSMLFKFLPRMDGGPTEVVGVMEVPSIQAVDSQDAMVADLLQQAAEAGGMLEGQGGVLEQGHGEGMMAANQAHQQLMEAGVDGEPGLK